MADGLGVRTTGRPEHRWRGRRAMEQPRPKVAHGAALALVRLGVRCGDTIGGLELNQRDAHAFRGLRGVFLSRTLFIEWHSQNGTFLGRNHLRIPVGPRAGHGTAFRRAERNAAILSHLYLSADEGDAPRLLAE